MQKNELLEIISDRLADEFEVPEGLGYDIQRSLERLKAAQTDAEVEALPIPASDRDERVSVGA